MHPGPALDPTAVADGGHQVRRGLVDHLDDHGAVAEEEAVTHLDVVDEALVADFDHLGGASAEARGEPHPLALDQVDAALLMNAPARTFGPGRSTRIPTGRSASTAALRIRS